MLRPHIFSLAIHRPIHLRTLRRLPVVLQLGKQLHNSSLNNSWFSVKKKKYGSPAPFDILQYSKSKEEVNDLEDNILHMKMVMRNSQLSIALRIRKLKSLIFEAIENSPDHYIKSEHLKAVDDSVNFIIANSVNTDPFSDSEMIAILKSSIKNLNLEQVRDLSFIPAIYSRLANSTTMADESTTRLEIFEIFVNYIILSKDNTQLVRLIKSYLLNYPTQREEVAIIWLDALKNAFSDSASLLDFARFYHFRDQVLNDEFFELLLASFEREDEHIAKLYREEQISILITRIRKKSKKPLPLYIKLLKYCSENHYDNLVSELVSNISRLRAPEISNEEDVNDLIMICLQEKGNEELCERILASNSSEIARLEYLLYKIDGEGIEEFLTDENKLVLDQNANPEILNRLLQVCLYSDKDKQFINDLDDFFQNEYGLSKNELSYKILIDHSIRGNDFSEGKALFENSIEEDFIDWGKEKEGKYVKTVFELFTGYTKQESDVLLIFNFYTQIKNFGLKLNNAALSAFFNKLVDNSLIGDALTLLEKELISGDLKIRPDESLEVYNKLLEYILVYSEDLEVNHRCYLKLDEIFEVLYKDYGPIMAKFCDYQKPELSYKIFTKMRNYSKTGIIEPPDRQIYTYLFEKFGQLAYEEGIFKLHLLLKVDMNVEPDINLLNSVMESFANVGEILKVRDTFESIMALPADRGLNSRTITIMLKSHTNLTVSHLNNFWNGLSQLDYLPTRSNYKQYLIGHCYHDCYEQLIQLVGMWDEDDELKVDTEILKILYNWTPSLEGKTRIDEFATENHKEIWTELKLSGELIEEEDELPPLIETGRDELLALNSI